MFHGTGYGNEGYGAVRRVYDSFTGKIEKDGEAKFTMGQSIARLGGMNVTPLAVPEGRNKQMRFEYSQVLRLQRLAKRDIKNMYIMRKPKEDIKEKIKDYKEKIKNAVVEFKEMMEKSKPPKQLIKAREAFLREKKQEALSYKNS
jgi:gas vesicle protein